MDLEKRICNFFPIISLWEVYVAMATKVPIQSVQKPYAAFPPTWIPYSSFNRPCTNKRPSPGLDVNGNFLDDFGGILRPLISAHYKKWRKKYTTICCELQNLFLDCQTYSSIFILVSNEMVNTGNHTATMLIFSVFCFPMITDDKKQVTGRLFIHACWLSSLNSLTWVVIFPPKNRARHFNTYHLSI